MAGVPYHAFDKYIAKLIEKGYKVAISEAMELPQRAQTPKPLKTQELETKTEEVDFFEQRVKEHIENGLKDISENHRMDYLTARLIVSNVFSDIVNKDMDYFDAMYIDPLSDRLYYEKLLLKDMLSKVSGAADSAVQERYIKEISGGFSGDISESVLKGYGWSRTQLEKEILEKSMSGYRAQNEHTDMPKAVQEAIKTPEAAKPTQTTFDLDTDTSEPQAGGAITDVIKFDGKAYRKNSLQDTDELTGDFAFSMMNRLRDAGAWIWPDMYMKDITMRLKNSTKNLLDALSLAVTNEVSYNGETYDKSLDGRGQVKKHGRYALGKVFGELAASDLGYMRYATQNFDKFRQGADIMAEEAYRLIAAVVLGDAPITENQNNKNVEEDKKVNNTETKNYSDDDALFGGGAADETAGVGNAGAEQKPRLAPEDYIKQADTDFIEAMREGRYSEIVDGIADLNYSLRNVMLIKSQMPDASKVMGLHAWNYQGRSIVGGEKSLKILAVTDNNSEAEGGAESGGNSGKNYRMSYVFDVSQTKGKAVKDKACTPEVLDRYFEGIKKTIAGMAQGYTFAESDKNGVSFDEKVISVQKGLSREEQLKAMIHGVARIRAEGKIREEGGEITQGRSLFNAIEESAVTHIAARRLGLGNYPLKTADFEKFDDGSLMRLSTNLHYVKMGAQRIINAVERYVSEAQSADALREARAAADAQPVEQVSGYYPIFNGNMPTVTKKSVAEAGG
jgi:hypothetical protein